jgi:type 1 glutamine amidotransferase
VNTYGTGRSFTTTLGHTNGTMASPVYLDLVARGLLWACDKLTDSGQPKRGYGPAAK